MKYLLSLLLLPLLIWAQAPRPAPVLGASAGASGSTGATGPTGSTGATGLSTGAAGGVLSGTYPNPGFASDPVFSGTVTANSGSSSGTLGLPGKTSGNVVLVTVSDVTAAGTLTLPGGLTATLMGSTGAFSNGDCVKASVSGSVTSFITTGSGCAAGNPASYWVSGTSVGIGPVTFTPTGSLNVFDGTASTGFTKLIIKEGAANQSGNFQMFTVLNSSNSEITALSDLGGGDVRLRVTGIASEADTFIIGQNNGPLMKSASNWQFVWQSAGNWFSGSSDLQLSRAAAGILAVGANGTAGDFSGTIKAGTEILTAAAPTVAAAQVGIGGTTAVVANCGALATACLVINVAGTTRYVPYF